MLTEFVMNLIQQEPEIFNELIWHYEQILCCKFESTDDISNYIYNVFKNANIIYNDDVRCESEFIEYFNKQYKTNYKTIKEIQDNKNIDLLRGDKIYAIIW